MSGIFNAAIFNNAIFNTGEGATPVQQERPSGGYTVATTAQERRRLRPVEDREEAERLIAAIAAQQASLARGLDEQQRLEHLARELEIRALEYESRYWEMLEAERRRLLAKEKASREDDEAILLLLSSL